MVPQLQIQLMKTATILALFLGTASALADDFSEKFASLKKKGDAGAIEKFLQKAASKESRNPNYYATAGNYWWGVAQKSRLNITPLPAGNFELDPNDLSITDPKTGKKVGAIGQQPKAESPAGRRAIELLTKGTEKFRDRADIALGLAHIQKESGNSEDCVATLVDLLEHAEKSPRSLKWMDDGKLPKPAEKFLPETVQTYSVPLFKADTPATDKLCARLLDSVIKTYPDHPYAYNLKAALSDAQGKPKEALKMLELAHQKNETDPLVLSNLAATYAKQGQKTKAIAAYQKLLKLKLDPRAQKKAKTALNQLKEGDK